MSAAARLELDPAREEAELRAYLGDEYDRRRLQRYEAELDAEFRACGSEDTFYRSSRAYLYNLTAFAMTGTKLPYLQALARHVPSGSRVLDYGCGIGSDGLALLEAGYRVEFADFDNPSTSYLRWRLRRRGLDAPVHDLDRSVPTGFDAAYAFDVIEHVPNPYAFLAEMEGRSAMVVVNLLAPVPDDQELHHELPIGRLLLHASERDLLSYRVVHRRSHLVVYGTRRVRLPGRVANLIRLGAGQLRRVPDRARAARPGAYRRGRATTAA